MILNLAWLTLALWSVTEQPTVVRRPTRRRLPEGGRQVGRSAPSTASSAVTLYLTRMRLAAAGACTTRSCAPLIVGGVRSTTKPGAVIVPFQLSVPEPGQHPTLVRLTTPLPEALAKTPVPPVIEKSCATLSSGTPMSAQVSEAATDRKIVPRSLTTS